jgi:peptidoglycan/xylan/chitin deacetylase (PgdA/CDA1 family)
MLLRLRHKADLIGSAIHLRSGLLAYQNRQHTGRSMLMFHSIVPERQPHLNMRNNTIAELEQVVRTLQKTGEIISVKDWVQERKPRQYCLTFDDGLYNNWVHAAPLLESLGVPASYYVCTSYMMGQSILWPDRLAAMTEHAPAPLHLHHQAFEKSAHNRWHNKVDSTSLTEYLWRLSAGELEQALVELEAQCPPYLLDKNYHVLRSEEMKLLSRIKGVTIGSHGMDHMHMPSLNDEALSDSLIQSKRYLESCIGVAVEEIAFPFGAVDERVLAMSKKAGYNRFIGVTPVPFTTEIASRFGFYNHQSIAQQLTTFFNESKKQSL